MFAEQAGMKRCRENMPSLAATWTRATLRFDWLSLRIERDVSLDIYRKERERNLSEGF